MKKILLILLLFLIGISNKGIGQNTCVDALQIYPNDTIKYQKLNAIDTNYWLKFTANDTSVFFRIAKSDTNVTTNVYLYHAPNGCNSYSLVTYLGNGNNFNYNNLIIGHDYFIKFAQNTSLQYFTLFSSKDVSFSLGASLFNMNNFHYCVFPLPSNTECELIKICENDTIEILPSSNYSFSNTTCTFQYDFFGDATPIPTIPSSCTIGAMHINTSFANPGKYYIKLKIWEQDGTAIPDDFILGGMHNCYITVLDDQPDSDILNVPSPVCVGSHLELINQIQTGYTFNFGNLNVHQTLGGMIYTDCPCPGTYPISATVDNGCGVTTTNYVLKVSLLPQLFTADTICPKDTIEFIGTSCIDNNNYYLQYCTYLWNFGDGYTSNIKNTIHAYSTPGVYTVTFTIFYNDQSGCVSSESVTKNIIVIMPEKPLITGNHSNCDKEGSQYKIQNYNPNYTYQWYLKNGYGTINNISNGVITIDWFDNTYGCPYDTLVVKGIDEYGCSDTSYFLIYSCCYGNTGDIVYFDEVTFSTNALFDNNINNYVFNENVIINANIEFKDATVHMGPNTKIIVNPDAMLTINNTEISSLIDCCNDMWDGIYVENPLSKLYINNKSIIQNAQNAVVSRNKGFINLLNSTLKDNYRNVIIEDYSLTLPYDYTPYPFTLMACTITGNYSLLHSPYYGLQTYTGIETKNVHNLTIGDFNDPSYKNTFENMYCGIKGVNSNLYIYNNDFLNIQLPQGVTVPSFGSDPTAIYQPTCIHSIYNNSLKKLPVCELIVGQSIYQYTNNNNMINCQNGVYSYNQRVEILGNYIESNSYGIWAKNIFDLSKINENSIGTNQYPSHVGIFANNIIPTKLNLDINNNLVFPILNGIIIANCLSEPRNGQFKVNALDNFIYFNPIFINTAQKYSSGIKSHNNNGIVISCNQINQFNSASAPTSFIGLFGINTIKTPHAQILNNYSSKMGAAINVFGDCSMTAYNCNHLEDSYYGFLFNQDAVISDQGDPYINTDNQWIGNYFNGQDYRKLWEANSLLNPATPIKWYVQNILGGIFDPQNHTSSNNPTFNKIDAIYNNNGNSTCINCQFKSSGSSSMNAELREKLYGKVVRNENNYVILDEQYKTYDMTTLYQVLKSDTSLMYLGDTSDATYQQFYSTQKTENIGKFEEVQQLITEGETSLAFSKNAEVQDQKLIDYYLKTATDIYLKTYCADNYNLTAQQIDFLTALANITPWEGGDGVYIARYMLNIEDDLNEADYAKAPQKQFNDVRINNAKLYPNPAQNEVMIEFDEAIDGDAIIEIYGFAGNLLQTNQLKSGYQFISVSVKDLKPGIYYYRITSNNEVIAKDKLLIIK